MEALILEIYPNNIDQRKIDQAINVLNNGGLIIYPTDTVYSMGCDATNIKAVENLCKLKNVKPTQNNFSIVCSDYADISKYAKVSNEAFRLIKKTLPGPFTIILPATGDVPKSLQTNRKTIGVRIPEHPIPQAICSLLGKPIITTSLKDDIDDIVEYPNEIEVIFEQNNQKVDLIIDGGWCDIWPSTVIDATQDGDFKIIRQGIGEIAL